ncbi:hypothetical protein NP233_g7557 [Leucocoprinus birnbaumii]|uniref:Major facilitator superfamily (MFS) profile domain-containing protein n=1 Tax=Leucocoprinus birnbaumii TaxID=56174 RepID=A0AAD5VPR8_9AGAR|nr:hypothetical protein NP233_g7557 [Leucocoprinus birnbaumii]
MSSSQTSLSSDAKPPGSKDFSKEVEITCSHEEQFDYKFERRTMLRVDLRLLPLLAAVYSTALIDRVNLGAAHTAGMGVDLDLDVGARFSIASCLYFVTYIIFQLPGNLLIPKCGIRNWVSFCVIAWGAVAFGMGFVNNWQQLTITRVFLGAFEACYFPAMVLLISTWYKRHEVQKRLAAFYLISITATGVSPILAWALSLLDGKRNIAGWRWIFIVEGALTLFLGVLCWIWIVDFPHQNKFLTPEQTALVIKRIDEDRGDAIPDELTAEKVWKYLGDWKLWAYDAQAYFISIILKGMGWDETHSLLLSAPPYGPPLLTCMLFSWLSDKFRHRSTFIYIQGLMCLIGLVLTAFGGKNSVRYFGTFLTNAGNVGTIPGILAWSSNNVVSHSKRNVQSAVTVMLGGIGGIMATTTFRAKDAPHYLPGG